MKDPASYPAADGPPVLSWAMVEGRGTTVGRPVADLVTRLLVAVDHPLPVEVLSRVDGLAGHDLSDELVLLERLGLLEWHSDDTLTATVIAHADVALSRAERAKLRGAAGRAATSSTVDAVVVAQWLIDSARLTPDHGVVRWALARSDALLRSGDVDRAIDVIAAFDDAVSRGLSVPVVDQIRLATRRGFLLRWTGRRDEADAIAERAVRTARDADDLVALGVAIVAWRPDSIAISDDARAPSILDDVLHRLPADATLVRSRLLTSRCNALLFTDLAAAEAAARSAIELARVSDDAEALIDASYALRLALWHPSHQARALELAAEMIAAAPRAVDLVEFGSTTRMQVFMETGDWAHLDAEVAAMGRRLASAPRPVETVWWTLARAARAQTKGQWDDAARLGDELLTHHVGPEYGPAFQLLLTQQVLNAWNRGEDLLPLVGADVLPAGPMRTSWEACLLGWTCHQRPSDDVRAELDRLLAHGVAGLREDLTFGPVTSSLAMAAARIRSVDHAAELYDALLPFADQWAGTGGAVVNGPYALHLAALADLIGRHDEAAGLLDRAERSTTDGACAPWLARISLARAVRSDAPQERRRHAAAALAAAEALGMTAVASDAQRLLGGGLPCGLTDREAEVLRLVASGATNVGIAETLFLSVKTVERHLLNAYRKIGARNRSDATAFTLRELS